MCFREEFYWDTSNLNRFITFYTNEFHMKILFLMSLIMINHHFNEVCS